jgi:hypothetical protein
LDWTGVGPSALLYHGHEYKGATSELKEMWSVRAGLLRPSTIATRLSLGQKLSRRAMTTLRFAPLDAAATATHTVTVGTKAVLSAASDAPVSASAAHAQALAVVRDGLDKSARVWDGTRSFAVAELEAKTSRNLGTIRADALAKLVQKHVPSKGDGAFLFLSVHQRQDIRLRSCPFVFSSSAQRCAHR